MEEIKIGDVVRLKSGGPAMTVTNMAQNGVNCYWWSPTKESYIHFIFPPILLTHANPDKYDR